MPAAVIAYICLIIFCMVLSAFFSGTETALVSSNPMSLESLSSKGDKKAKRSVEIISQMDRALSVILIGNNIANITAAAFLTYIAAEYYHLRQAQLVMVVTVQTVVFLILCELTPKVIARSKSEQFLLFFSAPLKMLLMILRPPSSLSLVFTGFLKRAMRIKADDNSSIKRDEIDVLFKIGGEAGIIVGDNLMFISEILRIKSILAVEIMTPTIDIISIEEDRPVKELIGAIMKNRFTRIPVYRDRVDNIIGYVFYRDLIMADNVKKISDIMHKPHYVPETKNIYELHLEMQDNVLPLVFVVNEYGAVVGMVSYEDIAEEVVGEIHARDQSQEALISQVSGKKFIIKGDLEIDHFVRKFPLNIEKKGFKTVSGYIMSVMGKIPKKGDRLDVEGCSFVVDEATDRSVERVIFLLSEEGKKKLTPRA